MSLDIKRMLPDINRTIVENSNKTAIDPRTKSFSVRQSTGIRDKMMTNGSYIMSQEDLDQEDE